MIKNHPKGLILELKGRNLSRSWDIHEKLDFHRQQYTFCVVGTGFGVPSSLPYARNSNFRMFKKTPARFVQSARDKFFPARRRKLSLCSKINEFPLKTIFSWKRVFMVAIFYFYFIVKKSYLPNALCDRLEITLIRSEIMKHYIVKNYFVSHLFCLNVNRSWDIHEKRFFDKTFCAVVQTT